MPKEKRYKPGDIVKLVLTGEKVMVLYRSLEEIYNVRLADWREICCYRCEIDGNGDGDNRNIGKQTYSPGNVVRTRLSGDKAMVIDREVGACLDYIRIRTKDMRDVYVNDFEIEPVAVEESRENICDHCGGKILSVAYCSISNGIKKRYCTDSCRAATAQPGESRATWNEEGGQCLARRGDGVEQRMC